MRWAEHTREKGSSGFVFSSSNSRRLAKPYFFTILKRNMLVSDTSSDACASNPERATVPRNAIRCRYDVRWP